MATSTFGDFMSSIGQLNLNFDVSNLILISFGDTNFPGVIQTFSFNNRERIQPLQCFNDTIHVYGFGKDTPTGSMVGFVLKENMAAMLSKYDEIRLYRNTPTVLTFSDKTISVYITGFQISVNGDSPCIANFNMEFIAPDSVLS